MDAAWPGLVVEDANLTVQISAIRRVLARAPGGEEWPPIDREQYDERIASGRALMNDDSAFDAAWQEGRGMTLEQAIEYALSSARV